MTRNLFIYTTAQAAIRETWTFHVPDDFDLATIFGEDEDLLEICLDQYIFYGVENTEVFDEREREVRRVELEEPT